MQDQHIWAKLIEHCQKISNQLAISYLSGFIRMIGGQAKDLMLLFLQKVRNVLK